MNQTFEWKRLALLLKKFWTENKKRYGLSMIALAGLLVIYFLFLLLVDKTPLARGEQQMTYYFSLFIVGSFFCKPVFQRFVIPHKNF